MTQGINISIYTPAVQGQYKHAIIGNDMNNVWNFENEDKTYRSS
jgi:hypothetical protein